MVSNIQVAGVICFCLALPPDVTQTQALARALEFRDYAAKAGGASYVGDPPSPDPLVPDTDPSFDSANWYFWSKEGLISVTKQTGRVRYISQKVRGGFSDEWNPALELSQASRMAFANNYFAQAGFTEPLIFRASDKVIAGDDSANLWTVMCLRKYNGVEYQTDYDVTFMLEYASGRLSLMHVPSLPSPPTDMADNLSVNQASAASALMLSQRRNINAFSITQPFRKVIWSPKSENLSTDLNLLSPAEQALGSAFRGKLVYWGELRTLESNFDHRFWVFVDPRDGHVLGGSAIGSFGKSDGKSTFAWTLLKGPLSVATGRGKPQEVTQYKLEKVKPPERSPGRAKKVILTTAELVVCADYYPRRRLLGLNGQYAKPSANLVKLLNAK